MRVLIVDDEADVRSVVARALRSDGHVVAAASTLADAREQLFEGTDLIVLDLRLPDGFGLDLCRELRSSGSDVPILLLTALTAVALRVEGFNAGADDYLAKPFAVAELRARVRALGRRGPLPRGLVYEMDGVRLDFAARRATRGGAEVAVTAREWAILEVLAKSAGRVVPRWDLVESVWGESTEAAMSSMEVLIGRIRRKLSTDLVRTLRGRGYALHEGTKHGAPK